jgi:hypothetical protein
MATPATSVTIPRRFCGPPDSGNGGYVCGVLARALGGSGDAEVTLRRPPPLERPLAVEVTGGEAVLRDGEEVIAQAVPTTVDLVVPPPVSVDDARDAAAGWRLLHDPSEHPFPTCFVCGPHREAGDGLRLFPSAVSGRADVVAAAWTPDRSLPASPHDGDAVAIEIVWASLDCPGGLSMYLEPELPGPYVLGRLAVHVDAAVHFGADYVAMGWRAGVDGRKLFAGSALYDARGVPVAYGRATWVRLA